MAKRLQRVCKGLAKGSQRVIIVFCSSFGLWFENLYMMAASGTEHCLPVGTRVPGYIGTEVLLISNSRRGMSQIVYELYTFRTV